MRRPAVTILSLALALIACGKGEMSSPCEDGGDCKRGLECIEARAPLSASGLMCSLDCEAEGVECDGGLCLGSTCVRACDTSAPDCPDGSVCADWVVQTHDPISGDPNGSEVWGTFCVLPCFAQEDCTDDYPFCPAPGGPCSDAM